jgi:hypothetical protein
VYCSLQWALLGRSALSVWNEFSAFRRLFVPPSSRVGDINPWWCRQKQSPKLEIFVLWWYCWSHQKIELLSVAIKASDFMLKCLFIELVKKSLLWNRRSFTVFRKAARSAVHVACLMFHSLFNRRKLYLAKSPKYGASQCLNFSIVLLLPLS